MAPSEIASLPRTLICVTSDGIGGSSSPSEKDAFAASLRPRPRASMFDLMISSSPSRPRANRFFTNSVR